MPTTAQEKATSQEDAPLLTITEEAATRLEEQMSEHEGTKALRLLVQEGCCGMGYAMAMAKREAEEGECVVESNGVTVYLDEANLDLIEGAKVSWNEGIFGEGFSIENPNEPENAGCGCR